MRTFIEISNSLLSVDKCQRFISSPQNGGLCMFIGTVRDHTNHRAVIKLDFEAYESMALNEMKKIADSVIQKFEVESVFIEHRVGSLNVGDIPVVIGIGSAHRAAAFKACEYAIDRLKETVPIWKKEYFSDGEVWVSAHP